MKRKLLLASLFVLMSISTIVNAQVVKSIDVTSARLSTQISAEELKTVTDLIVTAGEITADDITFMKKMTALSSLNMNAATTTDNNVQGFQEFKFKDVVLPITTKVINKDAFSKCSSLTSITIPEGVTTIGESSFGECASLTSITLPQSLTSIGDFGLYSCSSLTSIVIPNQITVLPDGLLNGCTALTLVTIPEGVTTIGGSCFALCPSLLSVILPKSLTTMGIWVFYNCSSLTSVIIPSQITTLTDHLFYQCSSLTSVTLPAGVTTVGDGVFDECPVLTTLICQTTTPPVATADAFSSITPASIKLYVPSGSVSAYQGNASWSKFDTQPIIPNSIANTEASSIKIAVSDGSLQVNNNEPMATVALYTVAGAKLASMVNTSCATFNNLPQGMVMVKVIANDGTCKVMKAMMK